MTLRDATDKARAMADASIDWRDHRVALALEAAVHAEENPPPPPGTTEGIPPWSRVSKAD